MILTPLQDFVADIVMPLCWMHHSLLLNRSRWREIPLHAQRMKSFFVRPDLAAMEGAIGKFLDGLEGQERQGFEEMHRLLSTLPVPTPQESQAMTHAEALDGKFLPDLDEEQRKRFTPSELILYKHAQDYRYIGLYTSTSLYIRVYTSIYCDIRLMLQVERR